MRTRLHIGMATVLGLLLLVPPAPAQPVRYDDHQVVRVDVPTREQLDRLLALADDVWTDPVGPGRIDVRVAPEQFARLAASGLAYEVLIPDVQAAIERQQAGPGRDAFDHYMPLDEVHAYLDLLAALRPDLAQTFTYGKSIEGRDLRGLHITGPGGSKPAALFHGGEHAREWIGVAVAVYLADRLVRGYDTDPFLRSLVDRTEWYIIPVMNPDGYKYTWDWERLWRKNRRVNPGSPCIGVDLNRNWSVGWGGVGSSDDPCSEIYHGASALSEPESKLLADFILARPHIIGYNDLHSYAQLLMYPYGYASMVPPEPDRTEFDFLAKQQTDIMFDVHGVQYQYGPIYSTIYPASGGSVDWAYEQGHTFAFTCELRDTGLYGFLLPPEQIIPTAEEVAPAFFFYMDCLSAPAKLGLPHGGESWSVGQTHDLAWFTRGTAFTTVDLSYSVDGGLSYPFAIASGQPRLGTLAWTVPDTPSKKCRVKAVFHKTDGSTAVDASPADFAIVPGPKLLYAYALDTNPGWSTQGQWAFGTPTGQGGAFHGYADPKSGYSGTNVYGVNLAGDYSTALGGPYFLRLGPIDLSGATGVQLQFRRWLNTDYPPYVDSTIEVSSNGGTWVPVWSAADEIVEKAWSLQSYDLSATADGQPTVYVRWGYRIYDGAYAYSGWNLDDVQIWGSVLYETGDVNCDGQMDAFDIDPFVLVLTTPGDPPPEWWPYCGGDFALSKSLADCNGDGQVDAFDIDPFVKLLTGG